MSNNLPGRFEALTNIAYDFWIAGNSAKAYEIARAVLTKDPESVSNYLQARMHMLLSLSLDSETAIYHGEKALDMLEHLYGSNPRPGDVEVEAFRVTMISRALKQLHDARKRKAEEDAPFDINNVRWIAEGRRVAEMVAIARNEAEGSDDRREDE